MLTTLILLAFYAHEVEILLPALWSIEGTFIHNGAFLYSRAWELNLDISGSAGLLFTPLLVSRWPNYRCCQFWPSFHSGYGSLVLNSEPFSHASKMLSNAQDSLIWGWRGGEGRQPIFLFCFAQWLSCFIAAQMKVWLIGCNCVQGVWLQSACPFRSVKEKRPFNLSDKTLGKQGFVYTAINLSHMQSTLKCLSQCWARVKVLTRSQPGRSVVPWLCAVLYQQLVPNLRKRIHHIAILDFVVNWCM